MSVNLFQLLFGEWLDLLFSFKGRINRAKYWLTGLIYFVALFAYYILFSLFFSFPADLLGIILIFSVPMIPIIVSSVAVAIKRLHDRDKSGWWLLVFYLLPGVIGNIGPYTGMDFVFSWRTLRCRSGHSSSSASCAGRPDATNMAPTRSCVLACRDKVFIVLQRLLS